jgi:hypothetical protein
LQRAPLVQAHHLHRVTLLQHLAPTAFPFQTSARSAVVVCAKCFATDASGQVLLLKTLLNRSEIEKRSLLLQLDRKVCASTPQHVKPAHEHHPVL